jgi:membrane protein YqaA with SNARE-associated domain
VIWNDLIAYGGLFLSAFGAATVLPLQSEAVLVGLLLAERQPPALLLLAACLGNTLGAALNWLLGRWIERWRDHRWFPAGPQAMARAAAWYRCWGKWSLLLSWMPVVGDPLTVAAGLLREPFPVFLALVALAKSARYLLLVGATLGWMP